MKLKIRKTKSIKNRDKPWIAKLESEASPWSAILVGYYYTWPEALEKGLVAYTFANVQLKRKIISALIE